MRSLTELLEMNVILRETNVFCAISTSKVYGPYFFPDRTVNGDNIPEHADYVAYATTGT